jgi:hypothetical protein
MTINSHRRNYSTNIPTNYSNYPSYINTVNYIDCLIMDKFNKYYSLGLLNNSRNENIKNNYLYNNNSFTSI